MEWAGQANTAKFWEGLAGLFEESERHPFTKALTTFRTSLRSLETDSSVLILTGLPRRKRTRGVVSRFDRGRPAVLPASCRGSPGLPVSGSASSQLSDTGDEFYLEHVHNKGDQLLVDEDLNITGIFDWQVARIVPRREAFALSLVSADMRALCDGDALLSTDKMPLREVVREGGRGSLGRHVQDEKMRRLSWGGDSGTSTCRSQRLSRRSLELSKTEMNGMRQR